MNWSELTPHVLNFFRVTCDAYPAKFTGNRLKQWLYYLQKNYPEAAQLFKDIKKSRDRQTIEQRILADIPEHTPEH